MTEQEADSLLDSGDSIHVVPNDMMGLLRLVYTRQAQILTGMKALDAKLNRLIEGMGRDETISPQTVADALDRLI